MISDNGVTQPLAAVDDERAEGRVLVTRVGLRFPDGLSFDDWEQTGEKLASIASSTCWCLGDWLLYGERMWTDRYLRAVEALGLDYQTLRNYAWIARRFKPRRRRYSLSFQHHAEVAALPPAEQDRWLEVAEQQSWSRNRLRVALRANRDAPAEQVPRTVLMPSINPSKERIARWANAAQRAGLSLENWIVSNLDVAAEFALDK